MANVTIQMTIKFPEEYLLEFLDTVREFDIRHDPTHSDIVELQMSIDARESKMTGEQV